jgi:hypothetical protein
MQLGPSISPAADWSALPQRGLLVTHPTRLIIYVHNSARKLAQSTAQGLADGVRANGLTSILIFRHDPTMSVLFE